MGPSEQTDCPGFVANHLNNRINTLQSNVDKLNAIARSVGFISSPCDDQPMPVATDIPLTDDQPTPDNEHAPTLQSTNSTSPLQASGPQLPVAFDIPPTDDQFIPTDDQPTPNNAQCTFFNIAINKLSITIASIWTAIPSISSSIKCFPATYINVIPISEQHILPASVWRPHISLPNIQTKFSSFEYMQTSKQSASNHIICLYPSSSTSIRPQGTPDLTITSPTRSFIGFIDNIPWSRCD